MTDAPDDLNELRHDIGRALDLLAEMSDGYIAGKEYYEGKRAEVMDSRAAERLVEQSKAAPLSFAHIPVDVIAEKVELSSIASPDRAVDGYLRDWIEKNDLEEESIDWILKACYFGDYYVVCDPTANDALGRISPDDVEAVGMSPLSTIVVYDKKTGRTPLYGLHVWNVTVRGDKYTKALAYYDDATVKLVASGENASNADDFSLDFDEEPEDAYIFHDGGRMLIAHLAVGGKPYGVPLHKKAYGPQDAITKISANNLVNVDALGLPSRWALLDPNAEVDDDIDDDFGDDGPSTVDGDGRLDATTGRRVRVVPGAVSFLRGVKQTGTYEGAQSDPFLSNLDFYIRAMGVACGIALFELDPSGEVPSGEARRRAEARANRTARRVQRQAGAFLTDLAKTMLALVGRPGEVSVTFTPTETATDKDGLELVSTKVKAGVPLRQALREAGYTDDQVAKWYPEGQAAFSPDLLAVVAEVLAKLGNAKTLGAITDQGIEAMLPDLFEFASIVSEGAIDTIDETPAALDGVVTNPAEQMKASADALGILIRAGVDQEQAAARVGLAGLTFPNLPTTIRVPETQAVGIEQA